MLTSERTMAPYRKGFREGQGPAIAVLKPGTLLELWQLLEITINANVAIVMQAANTGLTGGSTPSHGCDRDIVVINTTRIDDIHLLNEHDQILALPGASLYKLEKMLETKGRVPHSVIGSSCIGASIVGGICNNSGGALVERGPAYTELALYAKVDETGQLSLVNELDINLGTTPEEILTRLQNGQFNQTDIKPTGRRASDNEYKDWVRDTHSCQPARYNADPRRLHNASGCAGKLAVFAVRVDSFIKPQSQQTFYLGSNSPEAMQSVRLALLENAIELPISAEYLHRDVFEIADLYGRDIMLLIKHLGTTFLPNFFRWKRQADAIVKKLPFAPAYAIDKLVHRIARWFPTQIPDSIRTINDTCEHQLILTVKGHCIEQTKQILNTVQSKYPLSILQCSDKETTQAYLLRFAAAGAAMQYTNVHNEAAEGLLALDIALPRNTTEWEEVLPDDLSKKLIHRLYYGHFLCHVLHQDYVVKKGEDINAVKEALLAQLDRRNAEYPAEHNVGHLYRAKPALADNYKALDPGNVFNPGIGKMSKKAFYKEDCSKEQN